MNKIISNEKSYTQSRKWSAFLLMSVIWCYCLSNIGGWVVPEIVFNLIDKRNLTEGSAGVLAALELLGVAFGAFAISLSIDRIPTRTLALISAVILILTQYFSEMLQPLFLLQLQRFLCGFAQGILIGIASAILANGPNPHVRLAIANIVNVIFGSILLFALAPIQQQWNELGLFNIFSILCLILMPFCLAIPKRMPNTFGRSGGFGLPNVSSYWLVIAMFVFGTSSGASFTYSFLIGENAGLDGGAINTAISIAVLGAIPGSILCGLLGYPRKPLVPFFIVLFIHGISNIVYVNSTVSLTFTAGLAGNLFGVYFALPYLQSLSARYDALGSTSAGIGGAFFLSMAAGAYVGGIFVELAGLHALALVVFCSNVITGVCVTLAVFLHKRSASTVSKLNQEN